MNTEIFIGLGSNMGDRKGHMADAISGLRKIERLAIGGLSSLYETKAIGFSHQPSFYNAVLRVEADMTPRNLLKALNGIEAGLGRGRKIKWGPRSIDLDILLFGRQVVMDEDLQIPHPELVRRKFVLVPLTEVDPNAYHPIVGKSMNEIWANAPDEVKAQQVKAVEDSHWYV